MKANRFPHHPASASAVTLTLALSLGGLQSVRAVTYGWNSASTPLNWSSLANWSGAPTGNGPTGAGNIATNSTNGVGTVTTVLDNPGIVIGQITNNRGGSRNWIIGANGSFDAITLNNTGGSNNVFGNTNAGISASQSGRILVMTSIIMANTDLDFGSVSNVNAAATQPHQLGTFGSTSINSSDASGTRNLNLRNNSGATQTGSVGLLIDSAIGSINSGSAIAVNNLSTTQTAGSSTVTLAGPIGGASGVAANVSITNTATSLRGFVISGVMGQTVTSVTQNSATSVMSILGANTSYVGTTTVTAGTLLLNGSLGASALTANGGTFGGNGTTGGDVTINAANFAAGTSAGSLEIAGNLSLASTSTTTIELGGTSFTLNGTEQYDRTKLTGAASALNLGGGNLSLALINSFTLAANQAFGIFQLGDGASRAGTFNNLANDGDLVGNFGGLDLFITYSGNFGDSGTVDITGGNDIVLYTLVPEPAAALLGAFGMLALLRRRRA